MQTQTSCKGNVIEGAIAVVAIKRRSIIGKVSFEDVRLAVAIKVRDGGAHSGLLLTIFVEGCPRDDGHIGKCPVTIIVVKNAGGTIAGYINVRPAVIVKIEGRDTEGVVSSGLIDMGLDAYIFKLSISKIVIKGVLRPWQSARAAHHGYAFPDTRCVFAGSRYRS